MFSFFSCRFQQTPIHLNCLCKRYYEPRYSFSGRAWGLLFPFLVLTQCCLSFPPHLRLTFAKRKQNFVRHIRVNADANKMHAQTPRYCPPIHPSVITPLINQKTPCRGSSIIVRPLRDSWDSCNERRKSVVCQSITSIEHCYALAWMLRPLLMASLRSCWRFCSCSWRNMA